jgi:hypothetical protein
VNINLRKYWQLHRWKINKGNIPLPSYLKPVLSSLRLLALAAIVALPDVNRACLCTLHVEINICNLKEKFFRLYKLNDSGWKEWDTNFVLSLFIFCITKNNNICIRVFL